MKSTFLNVGHLPTIAAAFFYFGTACFVWVLLGAMGIHIANDLGLTPAQKGLMIATPMLVGALLRPIAGVLVDQFKPKRAGIFDQLLVIAALAIAWIVGVHSFQGVLLLGMFLGVSGVAFAVALPLASRWYPPEHQGKAMGIVGAGTCGAAFAALLAPGLATAYGWNNMLGLAVIPAVLALLLYLWAAKDSPDCPPAKPLGDYFKVLRDRDAWWFMLFYGVTFGGFVGLASSLTIYFHDQYQLAPVSAGYFAAVCSFAGSLSRPLGGALADRIGGIRTLTMLYAGAAAFIIIASFELSSMWFALVVFSCAMLCMGMGNGAVFQLVPQRFHREIGVMTGLVGMAGGLGGFWLASSLGYSKQLTGSYTVGLLAFAALALLALAGLIGVKTRWRTTWGAAHLSAAKV